MRNFLDKSVLRKIAGNYIKLAIAVFFTLTIAALQSCKKNGTGHLADDGSFIITGETIALSSETPSNLLKSDAIIKSVYKIGKDGLITHYQQGIDYVLTANGGIKRTSVSAIPDFSTQKTILNADGKFSFAPDPNRNPQVPILWQVMVDYSTRKDSLISGKSYYLSDRLKAKLQNKSDISIYCIGTSISAGSHTVPVFYDNKNTAAYVQLVAKAITKLYGNKVTVTNLAKGGADAMLFASEVEQIKADKPDLIFVEFGMNEHIISGNMGTYLAAIEGGVKTLTAAGIDCALVGFFQQNPQWESENPASTVYFNDQLREIATRNGVFFADIYNVFEQIPKNKLYKDLTGDYIHHPTDFGHKIYYVAAMPLFLTGDNKESVLLRLLD